MNRFQKKILTIAAGLANIGLALSAAAVATYAWFSANVSADIVIGNPATGLISTSIGTSNDVSLRYEVLQYDDNLKEGVSYQGDASKFELRKYDQWIDYNHRYENAILRCEVTLSDFNAKNKEINIDFTCTGSAFDGNASGIDKKTSNVIQFKSSIVSYKTSAEAQPIKVNSYIEDETEADENGKMWVADAATSYGTATEYFKRQRTSTSFVKAYKDTASKYHQTVTEVPYFPVTDDVTIHSLVMYIECSYSPRAVKYYINHRNSTDIKLDGDISKIKFYTVDSTEGGYEKLTPNDDNPDQTAAEDYAGDYLLVNDNNPSEDYANMFDPTISTSKIGGFANFTQTETLNGGNLIKANSATEKSKLVATQSSDNSYTFTLQTNEDTPRTIGKTANSGSTENHTVEVEQNAKNTIKNNKIYVEEKHNGVDKTYNFGMYNNASNARYGYYASVSSNLYKYNAGAKPSKLVSIRGVGVDTEKEVSPDPKPVYGIGQTFVKPTVYATYATGGEIATDISASCTFEVAGQDASLATGTYGLDKRVNIYYSENGITVSFSYRIDVLGSTYLSMSPEEVTVDIDSTRPDHTASLEATLVNQVAAPTSVTWTSASSAIATVASTNLSLTATVTAVAIGTTTITCTVVSNGQTYNATCTVVCRDVSGGSSEIVWEKVTSEPTDWTGTYLIVNEDHSRAFDGSMESFGTSGTGVTHGVNVTLENNTIKGEKDFYFTIGKIDSTYYYVKSASNNYIGKTSSSGNGTDYSSSTIYKNTISYDSTNSKTIITGYNENGTSSTRSITYNYNTGDDRFNYYLSTFAQGLSIQLYKRTGGTAEVVSISYGYTDPNQTTPPVQKPGYGFTPTGMRFWAQFSNGGETEITGDANLTFTQSATTAGTRDVTATYKGKSVIIPNVEWVAKTSFESLRLEGELTKTEYVAGTSFSSTGLSAIPTYNYGDDAAVTPTWYFSTDGSSWSTSFPASVNSETTYYVAASYTDPDLSVTKDTKSEGTDSPTITVYPRTLDSLTKVTDPTLSYSNNAKFAVGSAQINANYNTSSTYTQKGLNFDINVTSSVSWYYYSSASITDASTITTNGTQLTPGTTTLTNTTHNGKHVYAVYTDNNAVNPKSRCVDCGTLSVSAPVSSQSLTITRNSFSTSGGYAWYDWTQSTTGNNSISGKGELYTTTTSSMQFNKSKGKKYAALFNTTAIPGAITKIEAQTDSGTNRTWNAYVTSTANSLSGSTMSFGSNKTTVGSAITVTTSLTSLGTSTNGYSYFCVQENVSSASYISKFVITYTPSSKSLMFIGDLSASQKCEISGLTNKDALLQHYFDIALGKDNLANVLDTKLRNDYINCLERTTSSISSIRNSDRRYRFITYN